jgi:branched-chain amino acid transport system ATP-binding protein
VEHHMDLMMSVCDSLVVLDFGKVISRGSPQVIQADPAVTAAYLGVSGAGDE